MSVERVRVGDVLRLERRAVPIDPLEEYRLIGVYSFGKGIFHRNPAPGSSLGDYKFFAIQPDDLVLSNIQAWEGAIGHATPGDTGTIGTHRFLTYVPADDRIDTNWARWFFLSEPGHALIRQAAPETVMRNRTLAIDRFEALEIPLPPLDEQQLLATRLDRAASATERIGGLASRAATQREALIDSLVHGPAAPRRSTRLGDVLGLAVDSHEVQLDGAYKIAGVYSFGRGLFERGLIDGSGTKYKTLNRLRAGQLVMSRLKAWEGAIGVVPEHLDGVFLSPEFPTFDPGPDLSPRYLDLLVRTRRFWESLASGSKGLGARRERVSAERLLEQVVELPALPEQETTAGLASSLHLAGSSIRSRTRLVDALVPAALNEVFGGLR